MPSRAGGDLQFRSVSKMFWKGVEPVLAVDSVDLSVAGGDFIAVVGPSGCGKSTLLNMAAGLVTPSRGEILHDGKVVLGVNTEVGYLTQRDGVIPWRTVLANVCLPLEIRKAPKDERLARARQMIDLVGLTGFEGHYPAELSGGMRKRVALAATLVYEPATLLMDEPFGALDAQLKLVLHAQVERLWSESRKTIIFVTHDLAEAVALSDRVVMMSSRPGRIVLDQEIDLPRPRDVGRIRFDRRFVELYEELWQTLSNALELPQSPVGGGSGEA